MKRLITASVALGIASMTVTAVQAQQAACSQLLTQGCVCAAAIVPGGSVATLLNSQGNVVVTGATNYTPIAVPGGLHVGDGIILGPADTATVGFGPSCQSHTLLGPASASVTQIGSCACLMVNNNPIPPGVKAGAIVAGAGFSALFILNGEDKPVSP